MTSAIDSLTGAAGAGNRGSINQILRRASAETGVDFQYLLQTAERESAFNPALQAETSSATGLFQFIEQTWLATVKSDGARFGLGAEARQIEQGGDGQFFIRDQAQRQRILNLRNDPEISAKLAGALTQKNAAYFADATGRVPDGGELYIAHFLGAKGAVELIDARNRQPDKSAAELFPRAADTNRSIFYEVNGEERSVAEVYTILTERHNNANGQPVVVRPDPEQTLASHSPAGGKSSRYLASGPEAAFLAGHFGRSVNAFTPQGEANEGAFGAVFGRSEPQNAPSFFAPELKSGSQDFQPELNEQGVIPSRYGRVDEPQAAIARSNLAPPLQIPEAATADISAPVEKSTGEEVTLYPSVFNEQQKTVIITSSQFGKTDLPLDLSLYLKAPLPK